MKRILFSLITTFFIITACAPATAQAITTNEPPATAQPDDMNTHAPSTSQPGDIPTGSAGSNLQRGSVYLDSAELLTLESYPLQFTLLLIGNLPTPCNTLHVTASLPDSQNKIVVSMYSTVDPNSMCTQVLEPFEENFPLGSFPTGHYTLWLNGEQIAEFDS